MYTGNVIERLNELAAQCVSLNEAGEKAGWAPKAYAAWHQATNTYNTTKETLELLGFEVTREKADDGTYSHLIKEKEA